MVVVVPCYNEVDRLEGERFVASCTGESGLRFLFVNDGSSDGTGAMLDELAAKAPGAIEARHLPRNLGKAEAVRQGVLAALESDPYAVAFWDADLATDLEALPEFRQVLLDRPAATAVIGSRVRLLGRTIERSPMRHYLGRIFATAASFALGIAVYDTQCGAKAFRAGDRTRAAFETPFCSRWVFDVELIARLVRDCREAGEDPEQAIVELPLDRWRDVAGSKLRFGHMIVAVIDLLRIWTRYR
jgi:glycosyltransferase involved in cell wall biosynthesis